MVSARVIHRPENLRGAHITQQGDDHAVQCRPGFEQTQKRNNRNRRVRSEGLSLSSRQARISMVRRRGSSRNPARFWAGRGSAGCSRCLAKGIQSVRMPARRAFMPAAVPRRDRTDFLRFDFLEDDMATFTRLQGLLVSTGVAALGSATMLALLAGNTLILAGASETAGDPSKPSVGPDFPICHSPVTKGAQTMMLRLAQT